MNREKMEIVLNFRGTPANPWSLLTSAEAYWIFRDLPGEPHAILASERHSDGYFNISQATAYSNICESFATMLRKIFYKNFELAVDAVVSSSYAAMPIGMELARQLGAMFFFTEKVGDEQVWSGRFNLFDGMRLLHLEDLITTLGTVEKVHKAVTAANPKAQFLQQDGKIAVLTVVHRPAKFMTYLDYKIIPLMERIVHNWEPSECPLCKKGSEALKPKPNWARFQECTEYYEFRKKFTDI